MLEQTGIKLLHILPGVQKEIRVVYFILLSTTNFFDGKLNFIAVIFDARLDFYKIVAFKRSRSLIETVPHARLDPAGRIAQLETQIGFPFPRGANLFFTDKKVGGNVLVGRKTGDEKLFHVSGFFLGSIKSLLPDFFLVSSLSLSGVAATSSIGSLFTPAVSV